MHNQHLILVLFIFKWAHINSVRYRNFVLCKWNYNQSPERILFENNSDGEFLISIDKAKSYIIQLTTLEVFLL